MLFSWAHANLGVDSSKISYQTQGKTCKRVVCIICENMGEEIGVDGADQYFLHILLSTEHVCECYVIEYYS